MDEIFLIEREIVRVIFHLNQVYTRVIWQRSENTAGGSIGWTFDIPTNVIPCDLRMIGSCFVLSIKKIDFNALEDIEYLLTALVESFYIERL